MTNALATKVLGTIGHEKFKKDALLAYVWNTAAAVSGRSDVPSRAKNSTEEDLRIDLSAVLSRDEYSGIAELQSLLSA